MNFEEIIRSAIETFGEENQKNVCIEEMAELTNALMKERRGRKTDVKTEIADVIITALGLALIYGMDDVEKEIAFKVKRLKRRIDDHKKR